MIAIRFDGPPAHESGRFIEVERDGASISFGEWKQDGEYWLLELPEVDQLEADSKMLIAMLEVDQSAFVAITEQLDEHPENYERACLCATCRSYA